MRLEQRLAQWQGMVEQALEGYLPSAESEPQTLYRAIRHSLFARGKRARPALLLEACSVVGGDADQAIPAACAIECIHTYSLIHDDLPCMDDADERRGKPSCHKAFGEAIAVLAGDALLTFAFELLGAEQVKRGVAPVTALEVSNQIARAAGPLGMVGGQVCDIEWTQSVQAEKLYSLHSMKTGALIRAALEAGALLGGADREQRQRLATYGDRIGLAFQIADDLLDVEGDPRLLGKTTGDAKRGKITFPAVFGVGRSRQLALQAAAAAVVQLDIFGGEADVLREFAHFVVHRKH